MKIEFSRPTSLRICRMDSRNGRLSMSPTVPPISMMATSTSCATRADGRLDLVGDVRNDLNGLAEELPFALLFDDVQIDFARSGVVVARQADVREALVVPEVEIGLGAVVGHVDFSVLERAHRARIHVDVRIELEEVDLDARELPAGSDRGAGQALSER